MKNTCVSMRFWVGFSLYTWGATFFLIMSFWFVLIQVFVAHHDKTITFIGRAKMSDLFFCIDNAQWNIPNDCMDFVQWIAMATFRGWTFKNQIFCQTKEVELPLTRVVKMACFVTNFVEELSLFNSNNDCTKPDRRSFSTNVSFKTILGFGKTFVMMGSNKTFYRITSFVRSLGNAFKVLLIICDIICVALLTSWYVT